MNEGLAPTQLLPAPPVLPATPPRPALADGAQAAPRSSISAALVTPDRAMLHDESHRLRAFSAYLAVLCALLIPTLLLMRGDPVAKAMHLGAITVTMAFSTMYWWLARDPATFRPIHALGLASIVTLANASGFYYWGVFGPYAAIVPVAAYVIATGASRGVFWSALLVTLTTHVGLGIAIIAGWITDVGVFRAQVADTSEKIATLGLIDVVLVGSVLLARRARGSQRNVLVEHYDAIRGLAQREAQLAEAHAEMREVQAAGGRFTGQKVARFALGEVLGRGAMGEVYAAVSETGEPCAIKLLAPAQLQDEEARKRFEREVKLVASLVSPHIVRVIEVSPPDSALPYLAMERLDGSDLAAMIKDRPVRTLAEVVEIIGQVAIGLDAAHAAGIIHRDLKPQNLFAAGPPATPTWKVLDFGVSKLLDDGGTLTRDHIIGTPGYMAPEQARSEPVDARTDVYALGVLAYRLLTGIPAVMPGDAHTMLYEVVYRMPPQPSTLVTLSPAVEGVLAIAMAKQPTHRFASAGEFASALATAAAGTSDPTIESRSAAVLARTPWGHWLRRDRRASAPPEPVSRGA